MPVETGTFVAAGVVEHEVDPLTFLRRNLFGHGVEVCLENLGVAVCDDEADELAAGGFDGSDDVAPQKPAVATLGGATAALDPFVASAQITFETGFVAEKDASGEFGGTGCAFFQPGVPVLRKRGGWRFQ